MRMRKKLVDWTVLVDMIQTLIPSKLRLSNLSKKNLRTSFCFHSPNNVFSVSNLSSSFESNEISFRKVCHTLQLFFTWQFHHRIELHWARFVFTEWVDLLCDTLRLQEFQNWLSWVDSSEAALSMLKASHSSVRWKIVRHQLASFVLT